MKKHPLQNIDPSHRGKVRIVGISWFNEADYAAALAIMTDAVLPPTYALWLQKAGRTERNLQADGYRVVRAIIDPHTFPGWCARNGFGTAINAKARTAFAADYASRQMLQ